MRDILLSKRVYDILFLLKIITSELLNVKSIYSTQRIAYFEK